MPIALASLACSSIGFGSAMLQFSLVGHLLLRRCRLLPRGAAGTTNGIRLALEESAEVGMGTIILVSVVTLLVAYYFFQANHEEREETFESRAPEGRDTVGSEGGGVGKWSGERTSPTLRKRTA